METNAKDVEAIFDAARKIQDERERLAYVDEACAGDRALRAIAQSLLNNLRPMDKAIRYSGEEFLVVLTDTDHDTAIQVAEDVCIIAKDTSISTPDG